MLRPGIAATLRSAAGGHVMLCGGAPLDGPRHVFWNFVSSRRERIQQAKEDWKAGRFALPPDDHDEFIPLPEVADDGELSVDAGRTGPSAAHAAGGGEVDRAAEAGCGSRTSLPRSTAGRGPSRRHCATTEGKERSV